MELNHRPKRRRVHPATERDDIVLTSGKKGALVIADYLRSCFQGGTFCDAEIVCGDGSVVFCHQVVLAAISSTLARCLSSGGSGDPEGAAVRIHMPDHDGQAVGRFMEGVYGLRADTEVKPDSELVQLESVASTLRTDFTPWPTLSPSVVLNEENLDFSPLPTKVEDDDGAADYKDDYEEGADVFSVDDDYKPDYSPGQQDDDPDWADAERSSRRPGPPPRQKRIRKKYRSVSHGGSRPVLSDEQQERVQQLEEQMTMAEGVLAVKMRRPEQAAKAPGCFRAVLGVKKSDADDCDYLAVPLNWSPLLESSVDYFKQYVDSLEAARAVFGLSEVEAYHHGLVKYGLCGERGGMTSNKPTLMKEMESWDEGRLKAVLESDEVTRAHKKGAAKEGIQVAEDQLLTLKLVRELPPQDLDGVMRISAVADSEFEGNFFQVGSGSRKVDALNFNTTLIKNWTLHTGRGSIPRTEKIVERFAAVERSAQLKQVAEKLLGTSARVRRKGVKLQAPPSPYDERCQFCGQVFRITTRTDALAMRRHKKKHDWLTFECECQLTWETRTAKMKHMQLVHIGDFVVCEYPSCSVIFHKDSSRREYHMNRVHVSKTCELCGTSVRGQVVLEQHMARRHPEQASVDKNVAKKLGRLKSLAGTCKECGTQSNNLPAHMKLIHVAERGVLCDDCGQVFASRNYLQLHRIRRHTPNSEYEFACEECSKRFATKEMRALHKQRSHIRKQERKIPCPHCDQRFVATPDKKHHILKAHVKIRDYLNCRYKDCEGRFSDYRCRTKHEKQVHGRSYYQAAELGLVPLKPTKTSFTEEYLAAYKQME